MGHGQVWEIQTHNVVMTSLFHKAPPHATYLYNYLPQVLVHRATPRARCHRGTAPGRADGSHSGGSEEKRGGGLMMCAGVWLCVGGGAGRFVVV